MIDYIPRSHTYYAAQGYAPYQWATFADVPFQRPPGLLKDLRLALLTTAAPVVADAGAQGPGAAYNAAAKFFEVFTQKLHPRPDLRISHIGYDRTHCQAQDSNTWLPIPQLEAAARDGLIGELAEQLIGIPTNRSQRTTQEKDAPAALTACRKLGAQAALLVPT